jgi:hypothetical protein
MKPRRAAFGLLLLVCLAGLAVGVLWWLHVLDLSGLGYVGLLAVFGAIYLITQMRR